MRADDRPNLPCAPGVGGVDVMTCLGVLCEIVTRLSAPHASLPFFCRSTADVPMALSNVRHLWFNVSWLLDYTCSMQFGGSFIETLQFGYPAVAIQPNIRTSSPILVVCLTVHA